MADNRAQAKTLWIVLILNFSAFVLEMTYGFISNSMGLVADSLDMLADACAYGLGLWAIGRADIVKQKVATLMGWGQIILISLGFADVAHRFFCAEHMPDFSIMIYISAVALAINIISLTMLQKLKSGDANIKASILCSSVDVIVNVGVIVTAVLVMALESRIPDLIIGAIVFFIALREAREMLALGRGDQCGHCHCGHAL
jgi:Co/Zn/Cd efflux system component